jgi:hypothetical protein
MSIATEMQGIVLGAAAPVRPGDTVKAQQRRAWETLKRPAWWRLRAAWYGEAECWSARAVEDMRRRDHARREKEGRARAAAESLGAIYASLAERPDMDRARADHLLDVAGALGARRGPVDIADEGE